MKFKDVHKARERRDKKVRQLRRRQNLLIVSILSMLAIVLAGSIWVYTSDFWRIRSIEVNRGEHIDRDQVLRLARIPEKTGLLRFPGDEVTARILKDNWVKSVKISRRLPGTLIIDIRERAPVVAVSADAKLYLIDEALFVITDRQSSETVSIPVLKDLTIKRPRIGRRIASAPVKNVVSILQGLPAKLRPLITSAAVPTISKLAIYTKDNIEIVYGPARDMKKKNYIIEKILEKNDSKIIYINVSVPTNPVVRKVQNPGNR